jgi:dTDP-4-amino-4,6-dideoxygalactose transaminase
VIVPSFTFVATAHSLQWQQIKPIFCDVDSDTHTIDPACVEALITPNTTGIMGVHLWGRACDVEGLAAIAERRNLVLLFDAAHAFACTHKDRPTASYGLASALSFHATKFCNSFEGGAVVTDDDELAKKMRWMRNFGFSAKDDVRYIGSNGKMTEVAAAMGLTSIEAHEEFIAVNRANYRTYRSRLAELRGVRMLEYDEDERHNYHYIVLEVDAAETGIARDDLVHVLEAENVLARRYFFPGAHRMEPYRSYQPQADLVLPRTNALAERVLTLPTGTAVSEQDVTRVCDIVELACRNGAELTRALRERE